MRKLLNNPKFVTAMALLAIVLAWISQRQPDSGSVPTTAGEFVESAVDQPLPGGNLTTVSPEDALKQLSIAKVRRDPFAERNTQTDAVVETPDLPDLQDSARLTGVLNQNGKILLLLNDHIFQVGDKVGRFTIESASQEGVWLTHWKGRDFLPVGQSFVLKTPARQASTP